MPLLLGHTAGPFVPPREAEQDSAAAVWVGSLARGLLGIEGACTHGSQRADDCPRGLPLNTGRIVTPGLADCEEETALARLPAAVGYSKGEWSTP